MTQISDGEGGRRTRIVNPCGRQKTPTATGSLVNWPSDLNDLNVGFFGNGKSNVAGFLDRMSLLLAEHGAQTTCHLAKEGPMADGGDHRYQELYDKCDLVIVGVCDGGTAASIGALDATNLAMRGLPVVLVCTDAFAPLARVSLRADDPNVRMIIVPHPLSSLSSEETSQLATSAMDDLIKAMTDANDEAETASSEQSSGDNPDFISFDAAKDEATGSQFMYDRGLTDGLPVILPTLDRVDEMLAGWSDAVSNDDAPVLYPRRGMADPRTVAANAVMTGMPPAILPYLTATLAAAAMPEFKLLNLQTTTNPVTPVVVVGGPNRRAMGFNDGAGSIGGGTLANATLGRALKLCMRNIGGGRSEDGTDPATMGQPGKYAFCFAENEDFTSWPRLREQTRNLALGASDDAVTLVGVTGTMNMIIKSTSAEELLHMIAGSIRSIGSNDYMFGGNPMLVLCPEHAEIFESESVTLPTIQRTLFDLTKIPFAEFAPKNQEMMRTPRFGDLGALHPETEIPLVADPADILVCVTGGASLHSTFMPSFGGSGPVSAKVAVGS